MTTETLQALNEIGIVRLSELCNKIHDKGYISDKMKKSTFILLPKRTKAVNCTDFKKISKGRLHRLYKDQSKVP